MYKKLEHVKIKKKIEEEEKTRFLFSISSLALSAALSMARYNDNKCGRGTRVIVTARCYDAAVAFRVKAMSQQYRLISIGNGGSIQQYNSDNTGNSNSIGSNSETTGDKTNNQVEGMIK